MNNEVGTVDAEYHCGRPKVYLTPIEVARLMIVRSKLGDTNAERAAEQLISSGAAQEDWNVTYALWFVQTALAIVFLASGLAKLLLPVEALGLPVLLPAVFVRFIGVCEVLGALGLILPGVLRIRTELTPMAGVGLTILMLGATMFTPPDQTQLALLPAGVGLLAACVAYGRWRLAPLPSRGFLQAIGGVPGVAPR